MTPIDDDLATRIEAAIAQRQPQNKGAETFFLCPAHDDHRPSARWNSAKQVWFCDVCKAKGGAVDLARRLGVSLNGGGPAGNRRIVATYDYHDAGGKVLFQAVRYEPKGFSQRRPDGAGGWVSNLHGVTPVLYRLPELLRADPAQTVYIVEGEKDADRLAGLGLVATTNAMGAGKWRAEYAPTLHGRRVAILPDNDPPGRSHAQDVARSLAGVAAGVRIVELPGLPERGDVSDFLNAGFTIGDLEQLVDGAPEWEPPAEAALRGPAGGQDYNLTDMGNAERLVARHGRELRYCYPWGRWLAWDGRRWAPDESGDVPKRAKDTVRSIYRQAADTIDDASRKALVNHARRSEAESRIRAMIALAESEPGIPIMPDGLDRDPWLFNVLNGTLDLRTGELRPHDPADQLTRLAQVEYDPAASCPTWEAFLDRVLAGNAELIEYVQRAVGYSLTADVREQVLFILHGAGMNGKSTFLETLLALLGEYGQQTPTETLLIRRDGGIPNDIARLRGTRLVTAIEAEDGRRLAESLVKQMTGGDRLVARFLHREFFEFKPAFKLWLGTNHKPEVRGTDKAIWRRIRLVPFRVTISDAEVDRTMPEKLRAELPGILSWALVGCLAWQSDGLGECKDVSTATAEYRTEQDLLGRFLDECCMEGPLFNARAGELYDAYKAWVKQNGEQEATGTAFGQAMTERGFEKVKDRRGWSYRRIGLLSSQDDGNV